VLRAPWSPHWDLRANASYEASVLLQYTITVPEFEAGEHANENSSCCEFLMVENPV
jgi:hypothetical protein